MDTKNQFEKWWTQKTKNKKRQMDIKNQQMDIKNQWWT